jgi:hypothetical protein
MRNSRNRWILEYIKTGTHFEELDENERVANLYAKQTGHYDNQWTQVPQNTAHYQPFCCEQRSPVRFGPPAIPVSLYSKQAAYL